MHSHCIYRNLNGCGVRCKNKSESSKQYCSRHRGYDNYIFEVLNECFPLIPEIQGTNKQYFDSHDIYKLCAFIHTHDTYDVDDIYENVLNNDEANKKELFRIIIYYIFSKSKLKKTIHVSYCSASKKSCVCKNNIISNLYNILYNTFKISQHNIEQVIKIQRCFRRFLYHQLTKYNHGSSENETDPFTFDNINDIPYNERFGFKDSNGHVYIFNAVEFHHFIETNGLWNPYTRDQLPEYIKNHVRLLMIYHGLSKKIITERWLTPIHAFTEVSQSMEKVGFYNNVTWFNDLTYIKCCKIIRIFRDLCSELPEARSFFPASFELTKEGYIFEFCREVILMFENADDHYLVCCNFMKSLALNMDKFYHNLPSWLLNIESSLNINIDYDLGLNLGSNSDIHTDGLLFFYVYNLLDNIPDINQN